MASEGQWVWPVSEDRWLWPVGVEGVASECELMGVTRGCGVVSGGGWVWPVSAEL